MDVRRLCYRDASFDCLLDKATLDCLMTVEGSSDSDSQSSSSDSDSNKHDESGTSRGCSSSARRRTAACGGGKHAAVPAVQDSCGAMLSATTTGNSVPSNAAGAADCGGVAAAGLRADTGAADDNADCSPSAASVAMLSEAARVLRPGGCFVLVSHSGPEERLHLFRPALWRLAHHEELAKGKAVMHAYVMLRL